MNLVAKEYVACRFDDDGALVLSEFAGAADELRQAWLVNPYDINGMKAALLEAYRAEPREKGAPDAGDAPPGDGERRQAAWADAFLARAAPTRGERHAATVQPPRRF